MQHSGIAADRTVLEVEWAASEGEVVAYDVILASEGVNVSISVSADATIDGRVLARIDAFWNDTESARVEVPSGDVLVVTRGGMLSSSVRARSDSQVSAWVESEPIAVMGTPSPSLALVAQELADGIVVAWQVPLDTGLGDQETPILSYLVEASLCLDFAVAADCATVSAMVAGTTFTFAPADLVSSSQYAIRVTAANAVGSGQVSSSVLQDWLVIPAIQLPTGFPISVIALDGRVDVWSGSTRSSSLQLVVWGFPAGIDSDSFVGSLSRNGTLYEVSVTNAILSSARVWTLALTPPAESGCDQTPCEYTATVYSTDHPEKAVSFAVTYLSYPDVEVDSQFPVEASERGGSVVTLTLLDFTIGTTRYNGGLANLFDAVSDDSLTAEFIGSCGASAFSPMAKAGFSLSTSPVVGAAFFEVVVTTPTSPCGGGDEAEVLLYVNGSALSIASDISLQFVSVEIFISPSAGTSIIGSGGLQVSIILNHAGNLLHPNVSLHGETAEVELFTVGAGEAGTHLIVIRTPEFDTSMAGFVNLTVSEGGVPISSTAFELVAQRTPTIVQSSVLINGRQQTFVPFEAVDVPFSLTLTDVSSETGWAFDEVRVVLGTTEASGVQFLRVGENNVDVSGSLNVGSLAEGSTHSLTVELYLASALVESAITSTELGSPYVVQVVDTSLPSLISLAPTDGPANGGTVVLAAVRSARQLLEAPYFNISCASVVFGQVPMQDWVQQGPVYDDVVGSRQLWTAMTSTSRQLVTQYRDVVADGIAAPNEEDDAEAAAGETIFLLFETAASNLAGPVTCAVTSSTGTLLEFEYVFDELPEGPARVVRAATTLGTLSSGLAGGDVLTVELSDFATVYFASDLVVSFGGANISDMVLQRSDPAATILAFEVPAGQPGDVVVRIYPLGRPSNWAEFVFTYVDDRQPYALSISPTRVYNDGFQLVSLTIAQFPAVNDVSEVTVTVQHADGIINATEVAEVRTSSGGITTVQFYSTVGAAGSSLVVCTATASQSTVLQSLEYISPPTGAPEIVTTSPTVGVCDGASTVVTVELSNLRRVEEASDLQVTFGSEATVTSVSDSTFQVISILSSTVLSFTVPALDSTGEVVFTVESVDGGATNGTFECIDTSLAVWQYTSPSSADSETSVDVVIFIERFGVVTDHTAIVALASLGVVIADVGLLSSDEEGTLLSMTLQLASAGVASISVAPCASCGNKNISFTFEVLEPKPKITDVSPLSVYRYGNVDMELEIGNLPADYSDGNIFVAFPSGNVTVDSASFRNDASTGFVVASLTLTIPASTTAGEVFPVVHLPINLAIPFPVAFEYLVVPVPAVEAVPLTAYIATPTRVRLSLDDFPGVNALSNLIIQLEWLGGDTTVFLSASSYTQTNPSLPIFQVQGYDVDFLTPTSAEVREGEVRLRVWNALFPASVAVLSGFTFIDASNPQVTRVSTPDDDGTRSAAVGMSEASEVVITVDNTPGTVSELQVGQAATELLVSSFDAEERVSQVRFLLPATRVVATHYALVMFGSSGESACNSDCCKSDTAACSEVCGAVKTACFTLNSFDDAVPRAEFLTDLTGPDIGGDVVKLLVSNWPQMETGQDALLSLGDRSVPLTLKFSNDDSTELSFTTPALEVDGAAQVVFATLTHAISDDKVLSFSYRYVATNPALVEFSPQQGVDTGGVVVSVAMEFFPITSSVRVQFGAVSLASSAVRVVENTAAYTVVQFTTPATASGSVDVLIVPQPCSSPCGDSIRLTFEQLDSSQPVLLAPVPAQGAVQQTSFQPILLTNVNFTLATPVQVTFTNQSTSVTATVSSAQYIQAAIYEVVIDPPQNMAMSSYTVEVSTSLSGLPKSVSFVYQFYDGLAERVISFSPSTIPVSPTIQNRLVSLQSTISILCANLEALSPADVAVAFADSGSATVVSVTELAACAEGAVDCLRSRVEIVAPPSQSVGLQNVQLTIAGGATLSFEVEYQSTCDLDDFCRQGGLIPDVTQLIAVPTTACSINYCIDPNGIGVPELLNVQPQRGITTGGTVVSIAFENLPAFDVGFVSVTTGSGTGRVDASILTLTQDAGGSLLASSGTLSIEMPGVPEDTTQVTFTVLATVSAGVTRSATFTFDYFPPVVGSARVLAALPSAIFASQDLSLVAEIANVPWLARPFDVNRMLFSAGDASGAVTAITASTRASTLVELDVAGPFAVGTLDVQIYSADFTDARAATISVQVRADPSPQVRAYFPPTGSSAEQHTVSISVAHLPLDTTVADISAELVTETATTAVTTLAVEVVSDATCTAAYCSLFAVDVQLPSSNPDGTGSSTAAAIVLSMFGDVMNVSFAYTAVGEPVLELFDPPTVPLLEAGEMRSSLYLKNFPSATCSESSSCATEAAAKGTTVSFGGAQATIEGMSDVGGLLLLVVIPPVRVQAGEVDMVLSCLDNDGALQDVLSFPTEYLLPAASVSPIDASTEGGSTVTIVAEGWGSAGLDVTEDGLAVEINGEAAETLSVSAAYDIVTDPSSGTVVAFISSVTVVAVVPESAVSGTVSGTITASELGLESTFDMLYFVPSTASANPSSATIFGTTSAADGVSTFVTIFNFPDVDSAQDVEVFFGDEQCSSQCGVTAVQNSAEGVTLTIRVPTVDSVGAAPITINFVGAEAAPLGADPTDVYVRTPKSAVAAFQIFIPAPETQSLLFCNQCNAGVCLQNGRCGADVIPQDSQGPIHSAEGDDRVLTVSASGLPAVQYNPQGMLTGTSEVRVLFGGTAVGTVKKVVYSDSASMVLEVEVPEVAAPGTVEATLVVLESKFSTPVTLSFAFTFFDDTIALSCGACQAAAGKAAEVMVHMTNFALFASQPALDQVLVSFGAVSAESVDIVSTNSTDTLLRVVAPAGICSACSFAQGQAVVSLSVVDRVSPSVGASTSFSLWAPPQITSARFNTYATAVDVVFDSNTDEGGADDTYNCSAFLASDEELGTGAICVWISPSLLRIYMGEGPSLQPGSELAVRNMTIRSANGVSLPSDASASVRAPQFPVKPELSVFGPSTVDQCAALRFDVFSSSSRPLTYSWSCSNDADLDLFLRGAGFGSTARFDPGTPQMTTLNKLYVIEVTATDFLGTESEPVRISVTKRSAPAPEISFQPPAVTVAGNQAVLLRSSTVFSECIEQDAVEFTWSQVSGPALPAGLFNASTPSMYISAGALEAGSVYVLSLQAAMRGDPSKTSSNQVVVTVTAQPLVAVIAGGSSLFLSTQSSITLDASGSSDPDDADAELTYSWSCAILTVSGRSGRSRLSPCFTVDGSRLDLATTTTSVLVVSAGTLAPTFDNPYLFTVAVRQAQGRKTPASFTMPVTLTRAAIPTVTISSMGTVVQPDGSVKFNPRDGLLLEGACQGSSSLTWTIDPPLVDTTPTAIPFGFDQTQFKVDPESGILPAQQYEITLECESGGLTGRARLVLLRNDPPQGDACTACVSKNCEIGTAGCECEKEGQPLDLFVVQCSNWADSEDPPLEYRFGFTFTDQDGNVQDVWFEWASSPLFYYRSPTGTLIFKTQVRDRLGSESAVMYDAVVVSDTASRRRSRTTTQRRLAQVASSTLEQWQLLVQTELNRQDAVELNKLLSTLGLEANTMLRNGQIATRSEAVEIKSYLVWALAQGETFAVKTVDYVCSSLALASVLSIRPEHLTQRTARTLLAVVDALVTDPLIPSLTQSCASSGFAAVANALHSSSTEACSATLSETPLLGENSEQTAAIVSESLESWRGAGQELSNGLTQGETAKTATTNTSVHLVWHASLDAFTGAAQTLHLSHLPTNAFAHQSNVTVLLPPSTASDLGFGGADESTLLISAMAPAPLLDNLTAMSPLVDVSLTAATHMRLSEAVNVTLPVSYSVCQTVDPSMIPTCMIWNSTAESFAPDDSCLTLQVGTGVVTCSCNQLGAVIVVAAEPLITTSSSSTTPAPTTTSSTTASGTTTAVTTAVTTAPEPTPAPVDAVELTLTGSLSDDGSSYYNLVRVLMEAPAGTRISYVDTASGGSQSPSCDDATSSTELRVTFRSSTTVTAVACKDGRASDARSVAFTVSPEVRIVISMTIQGTGDSLSEALMIALQDALAAYFGLAAYQVEILVPNSARRRMLAVDITAVVYAESAEQGSALRETGDRLTNADISRVVQDRVGSTPTNLNFRVLPAVATPAPSTVPPVDDDDGSAPIGQIVIAVVLGSLLCLCIGVVIYRRFLAAPAEATKQPMASDIAVYGAQNRRSSVQGNIAFAAPGSPELRATEPAILVPAMELSMPVVAAPPVALMMPGDPMMPEDPMRGQAPVFLSDMQASLISPAPYPPAPYPPFAGLQLPSLPASISASAAPMLFPGTAPQPGPIEISSWAPLDGSSSMPMMPGYSTPPMLPGWPAGGQTGGMI